MTDFRFTDLPLSAPMYQALETIGYVHPTPVQRASIPLVATGCDLMVQSQTGTGKTAAFGIPLIEALGEKPKGIQALVLAPTRELAKQVAEEFSRLAQFSDIRSVAIYGGASFEKQVAEARFANIVCGTPGRVLDHLKRGTFNLKKLRMLILDEADEMLSMGFARELEQIMRFVPKARQTLLFSATIPEDIKRYAKRYMKAPEFLSLIEENVAADDVEHIYYMVSGVGRPRDLIRVLEFEQPESAIIFTNTRKDTEIVCRHLKRQGFDAEYLNGDLAQRDRERVMKRAKEKTLRFLVATDIAARGIDIASLSHVINFVLPESAEVYIHRTGRTGRAGAKGTAISLIGPREIGVYYYLKRLYNVALTERTVPTQAEIDLRTEEKRTDSIVQRIMDRVGPIDDSKLRAQTMRILERDDAVEVVQALLKAFETGGTQASASFGGLLDDVPKPRHVAPGGRQQTVQGVADRVKRMRGEHRGPSAPAKPPRAAKPVVETKPEPVIEAKPEPVVEAKPEPVVEAKPEPVVEAKPEAVVEAKPALPEGQVKLFVNLGKRDVDGEDALRDTLADLAGLWPEDILDIELRGRHSYVVLEDELAEDVIEAINGETLGRRTVRIEVARD
jgi:ATP-dependent RNA helicase DeaD